MSLRSVFLVAGLALTVAAGASAADQFSEDLVLNGDQMAELSIGVLTESSEPSFIEDQEYLAAIEAAAAAEWAMSESASSVPSDSGVQDLSAIQSESIGMEPSALAGEPVDFQPTPSS